MKVETAAAHGNTNENIKIVRFQAFMKQCNKSVLTRDGMQCNATFLRIQLTKGACNKQRIVRA